MNPYKAILEKNLSRLINLFNLNPVSPLHGVADRAFAGWKISDFANATFQGGVYALAVAYKLSLVDKALTMYILDSAIRAIPKISNSNGSLNEAYPNEHSFCVTALVAHDCLSALDLLKDNLKEEELKVYFRIIAPLINFITKHGEKHAIISNHLATGVAAIDIWNKVSGSSNKRRDDLLELIYKHQSDEGWYQEYEGADPGYQTLCTYYLARSYSIHPDQRLLESLKKSAAFLKYFAHPDSSLGGVYGSRNTEVYYPGGLVALSQKIPEMGDISSHLSNGITTGVHILPQDIDAGNFVPLLNSYAYAALLWNDTITRKLPFEETFNVQYESAGIYICSTAIYYCIVNFKKGGTISLFDKIRNSFVYEDGGVYGKTSEGKSFSSQVIQNIFFEKNEVSSGLYLINESQPTPLKFILLRLLSLLIFWNVGLGNVFKKRIVSMLMTGKKRIKGSWRRRFSFEEEKITVHENLDTPSGYSDIHFHQNFRSIHMASSGYHTAHLNNEQKENSLIEFLPYEV